MIILILLIGALFWLLALTVLQAGIVSHLMAREMYGEQPAEYDANQRGALPEVVMDTLRDIGFGAADYTAAIFSATCGTCLRHARKIAEGPIDPARTLFLITGSHDVGVRRLNEALAPTGATLVHDDAARAITEALGVDSTPFMFRVSSGYVLGRAYLRRAGNFHVLAAIGETSAMRTETREEVNGNV